MWSLDNETPSCVPLKHPARITAATFSPDGGRVLTGCADRRLRLWDVDSGRFIDELCRIERGTYTSVEFSGDGGSVFGSIGFHSMKEKWGEIFRWDCRDREFAFRRRFHGKAELEAVCWADSRLLIITDRNGNDTACLLDARTGDDIFAKLDHPNTILGAALTFDQTAILTWSGDKTARIWDVEKLLKQA